LIKNIGDEEVYILPYLEDIIINNKLETLSGEQKSLKPGEEIRIKLKARLTPEDIEDNEKIKLKVLYGAQEDVLVKKRQMEVDFKLKSYREEMMIAGAGLLVLLIIILILLKKKKKHRRKHQHHFHYRPPPPKK